MRAPNTYERGLFLSKGDVHLLESALSHFLERDDLSGPESDHADDLCRELGELFKEPYYGEKVCLADACERMLICSVPEWQVGDGHLSLPFKSV